ncbi:MAG: hypothetical protein KDB26_11985, partial [Microthrixaceae bacterium]|nr:hypothetical protein [Microthrixaceae bacterium]
IDTIVVGVPDETWGSAVCAVVQARPGSAPDLESLRESARGQLAGYKLPRHLVLVDQIVRSPSGKPDTRWAARVAAESSELVGAASGNDEPDDSSGTS